MMESEKHNWSSFKTKELFLRSLVYPNFYLYYKERKICHLFDWQKVKSKYMFVFFGVRLCYNKFGRSPLG